MADRPIPFDVLVSDDDPDICELFAEFLDHRGLVVATAPDGRAAVDALRRSGGRYGLVFTDIGMPGADGFAVLTAARAANPNAYVVMITGYASLDTAISAIRLGAQDYLTKPFSLGEVDLIVQQASERALLESAQPERSHAHLTSSLASIDKRLASLERQLTGVALKLGLALQ